MTDQLWTLDELTGHVTAALADGYPGAPSARVRDVPDARTIRWYTTRGLVDPPLAMRGRQALYGRRHLLQLVALKRRQAEGAPLALIQTELSGLPDTALAAVASLAPPARGDDGATRSAPPAGTDRVRFWSIPPARPGTGADLRDHVSADVPGVTELPGSTGGSGFETLHGIRLAPGVVLLLDADIAATAHPLDDAALRAAAVPLLALLHRPATDHEGTRQ